VLIPPHQILERPRIAAAQPDQQVIVVGIRLTHG